MKSNELKAPYETPELNETAVSVEMENNSN